MSEYLIFVRLWPGFVAPFPFERFNHLPGYLLRIPERPLTALIWDPLQLELDKFAESELAANRGQFKLRRAEKRRQLIEAIKSQSARRTGPRPKYAQPPESADSLRQRLRPWRFADHPRGVMCRPPLICRLGTHLGWWNGRPVVSHNFIVTPRIPLGLISDRAAAVVATEEMQLDFSRYESAVLLSPKFGFLEVSFDTPEARLRCQMEIERARKGKMDGEFRPIGEIAWDVTKWAFEHLDSNAKKNAPAVSEERGTPQQTEKVVALAPKWDKSIGELRVGQHVAKRVRNLRLAANVVRILDTFQEEGWPDRIDDPLPFASTKRSGDRLRETIRSLNKGLSGLRFYCDGTSEGICWERAN